MGEKEVISRRGLAKNHAALDYEVWQWKINMEKIRGNRNVTKNEVQAYALKAYKTAGITNFKASDGWYRRWRIRWQNSSAGDLGRKEKYQSDEVANEVTSKAVIQDTLKKRKVSEVELFSSKRNIQNTEESDLKAEDKPQSECGDIASFATSVNDKTESQIHSGEEATNFGILTMKNTTSVNLNPTAPGLDSLLLSVNLNKLKQDSCKKRFKLSPCTKLLKSQSVSSFASSADLTDSFICKVKSDTTICQRTLLAARHSNGTSTSPVDFQTETPDKPSEQDSTTLEENVYINRDEKTVEVIGTTEEANTWTVVTEVNDSLPVDSPVYPQSDSGISIPSSGENLEATDSIILSPIFEQSDMDFSENEHEVFCDSCEDFHPREKCLNSRCKLKKESRNSFLLNCVFEMKDSVSVTDSSVIITSKTDCTVKKTPTLDSRLNNASVVAPKGKRYLVQFKSKVVNYALNHSVKQAAEKFRVNRNTVADWLAERTRSSSSAPLKHVVQDVAVDSEFLTWLEDSKFNLTNELVKQKALEWLRNSCTSCCQSQWLRMYAQRLSGTEDVAVKKRYIVYPEAFKRAVVFHAQTHSNMAAARVFGVARKRIIEWQTHSGGDTKRQSKNMIPNNVTDEEVDVKIYEWFCQQNPTPTSKQVRQKAVEQYRASGYLSIQCSPQWYYRWRARHNLPNSRDQLNINMTPLLVWALSQLDNNKCVSQSSLAAQAALLGHNKVSRGWTFRFCKKYSALLQGLPDPETPLPSVLEAQVSEYKRELHSIISTQSVTEDCIIALDEIPLHFLPKDKSRKPLLVRRPGFESCQASLMVSSFADGTLLPTLFVFKGSGPAVNISSDRQVMAFFSDTGQVSDDVMQHWLSAICFPYLKGGGVLVLDSFDKHVTPEVTRSVKSRNVHVAVMPPGCAFRLLPVTPFCHSFKTMLEDMCQVWLSSQIAVLESPSPDQLYLWAVRVHKHIAKHYKEKIQTAFRNMLLPQPSQCASS